MFLLFLIIRFNRARLKLRATNSPIFFAFYCLVRIALEKNPSRESTTRIKSKQTMFNFQVVVNVVISVLRCFVSMLANSASVVGGYTDIILWIFVRFFLLLTEMSVIIFGLAFGKLRFYQYFEFPIENRIEN